MIPVEAAALLQGDVAYTEEVPIRVRWVIADLGGHVVDDADVLVTTDIANEVVRERLDDGAELIKAPSLQIEGDRELPPAEVEVVQAGEPKVTEVPGSVMDELEGAVAIIARALRQGEWERSQTHETLVGYLREETEELAQVITSGADAPWFEEELCKELSDVFLQVLFHAEIANRRGSFDIGHVAEAMMVKLRSRAPYLFEEEERDVPRAEQDQLWAAGKKVERQERVAKYGQELPMPENVLAAAEQVIRQARSMGLSDAEIPTDIRFPMIGLEMDQPGQAEKRLFDAVRAFRQQLASRAQS